MVENGVPIGTEIRKRNVAFKLRIGDILKGRSMVSEGKFLFLELPSKDDSGEPGSKKVVRVNVIANCVDKFVQEGEKKYATLTVDDASGQFKLKAFGDDVGMFRDIVQGDTLQIIGNVREWNGELYVIAEVVKKIDSRWLLVRKLEIQDARKDIVVGSSGLKGDIMGKIKAAEVDGGIDVDGLIMDIEANPDAINDEVKKLLEEGLIYEPRPGRLRYLG